MKGAPSSIQEVPQYIQETRTWSIAETSHDTQVAVTGTLGAFKSVLGFLKTESSAERGGQGLKITYPSRLKEKPSASNW